MLPAPAPVPGRIVALRRDGSRTDVGTPWPVLRVATDGDQLAVTFAQAPIAHPGPHGRDAGLGVVSTMRAVGREVWLTVARRRFLAVPHDRGVEVLAVSTSGGVRTVHRPNSIDISFSNPPREQPPDEVVRTHVERVRARFEQLDTYWRDQDGAAHPLSRGLSQPSVSVEGDWPDTRLAVTLRHPSRPGLRLRRTFALFDERGRPLSHEYAEIHLMEDLDTGYIAPADEARDGVLDT
jgi:hypothetical protein